MMGSDNWRNYAKEVLKKKHLPSIFLRNTTQRA
ncbi:hypothetical protein F8538_10120 [Edwardsiella ictaluri]|nr:hypothetical protein B6E78_04165 [Edwardsiella ictaluri]QPW27109.1 hypothetical protein F8538_10120 [Edwardsiella ictaluri]